MNAVLSYFIQMILLSGILYGYYHIFLRNTQLHQYNRFYLLLSTLSTLIIPLINIPVYFSSPQDIPVVYQKLSAVYIIADNTPASPVSSFSIAGGIALIYFLVAGFAIARIVVALLKLATLFRKYPVERMNGIRFVTTTENDSPFSFFRWLFWNKEISLDSEAGKRILHHELVHIRQRHSWDIIYLELLTALCWFNPFFHLIKKETRAIHEFLADRSAAGDDDHWEYAELLVMQVLKTRQRLIHPFFHNEIKRRITMITNFSTTRHPYMRKAMVLPVALLAVVLIAVNCTSKDGHSLNRIVEKQQAPSKVLDKVDINSNFPGGPDKLKQLFQKNIKADVPVMNGAPKGLYNVMIEFIVHTDGSINEIKPLTTWGFGMEDEVIRVIKASPKWYPALVKGTTVNAYRKQSVVFVVDES